ncbi:MAG TPA: alpha/beta fold hydrolase [Sphingomicrobium sp.]|nr:alpha/beta fold hydrolase [Sphingomicrobium sp.]
MAWSQDELIFPTHAVAPADPLPADAERLTLDLPDGDRLHGVHIPPAGFEEPGGTLVLGFGGNAWNGENVAIYLHELYPQAHVVAFHYRGYRPSTGRPSADALVADAPLVLDAAIERVKPKRVIAVGFSIGSGVAASLAKNPSLDGLILVTPFDSLKAVARELYPWLPIGAFFRHEIDAAGLLRGSEVPVAIVAAGRDEIIPPGRTGAFRQGVPNLVFDRTVSGAGHNDIYGRPDFQVAMREALNAVAAP